MMVYDTNFISTVRQKLEKATDKVACIEALRKLAGDDEFKVAYLNGTIDKLVDDGSIMRPSWYKDIPESSDTPYILPEHVNRAVSSAMRIRDLIDNADPYYKRYGIIVRGA